MIDMPLVLTLRSFMDSDAEEFQKHYGQTMSLEEIKELFRTWNTKEYEGKYFEMFAIVVDDAVVGKISIYQHSATVVSIGPEIFEEYRRRGFAEKAMSLAIDVAKGKGYKIAIQQIRVDNVASIALHNHLGFETDGYVYKNRKDNKVIIYLKSL